jgi:hypothetical protein
VISLQRELRRVPRWTSFPSRDINARKLTHQHTTSSMTGGNVVNLTAMSSSHVTRLVTVEGRADHRILEDRGTPRDGWVPRRVERHQPQFQNHDAGPARGMREAAVRARRPSRKDEVRDDLHCERQGRADGGIHQAGEELCISTPKGAGSYGQILQARRSVEVMSGFTVSRAVDDAVTVRPEDAPSGNS